MAYWLKNSLLGIIVLGTIGSVLAYFLLKISGWIARKLASTALERFLFFSLRPMMFTFVLAQRFLKANDIPRFLALSMFAIGGLFTSIIVTVLLLVADVFYFSTVGVRLTAGSFFLVTATGLFLIFLFRDIVSMAGYFRPVLERDWNSLRDQFKQNEKVTIAAAYQVFDEADPKKPKGSPPKSEPPPTGLPKREG